MSFLVVSEHLGAVQAFLPGFSCHGLNPLKAYGPFTEAPESWPHLAAFNQRLTTILNQPPTVDDTRCVMGSILPRDVPIRSHRLFFFYLMCLTSATSSHTRLYSPIAGKKLPVLPVFTVQ